MRIPKHPDDEIGTMRLILIALSTQQMSWSNSSPNSSAHATALKWFCVFVQWVDVREGERMLMCVCWCLLFVERSLGWARTKPKYVFTLWGAIMNIVGLAWPNRIRVGAPMLQEKLSACRFSYNSCGIECSWYSLQENGPHHKTRSDAIAVG